MVIVTHDRGQAERLAGRIVRIQDGRVTWAPDGHHLRWCSLALVARQPRVALAARRRWSRTWAWPVLRSFLQLTAVGYVIQAIFDTDSLWLVVGLLLVMVGFGSVTARSRARACRGCSARSCSRWAPPLP